MNTFRFRIYYRFVGPSKADALATQPMTARMIEHHLGGLEHQLRLAHRDSDQEVEVNVAKEGDSAIATVKTDSTRDAASSSLAARIAKINNATSGLSLFMDDLP